MIGILIEGLIIATLGMGFVFLFLTLLVFCTSAMGIIVTRYLPATVPATIPATTAQTVSAPSSIDPTIVAAITEAVALHRKKSR